MTPQSRSELVQHVVTYAPKPSGRSIIWRARCACNWNVWSANANAVYAAAMEHGEFA